MKLLILFKVATDIEELILGDRERRLVDPSPLIPVDKAYKLLFGLYQKELISKPTIESSCMPKYGTLWMSPLIAQIARDSF